jgi:bifunctional DNA-binding transcriptional regulator/antitoxin component of YhaV-PrlF toxin-antitoxin module
MNRYPTMAISNHGEITLPAELRSRHGWRDGTTLLAIETQGRVMLATRPELEKLVRAQLGARSTVAELIKERRAASVAEDLPAG